MKTIFISAFNPFILRNVLISDALKILQNDPKMKVVVLVPDYKADFFKREISTKNIIIEGVARGQLSRQDIVFRFINSSLVPSRTLWLHKREQFAKRKSVRGALRLLTSFILTKFIRLLPGIVRLFRFGDYHTMRKDYFVNIFEQHRPAAIFATDIFNDDDVHLMAEARKRGIKIIGMVRSWDNFTTKGVPRIQPDSLIVQNEILKQEAVKLGRITPSAIFVSGMPQYDHFIHNACISRNDFFKKIGLNSKRKLILYSPFGNRFSDVDGEIMDILKKFIKNKQIPDANVLVRNTPNDAVAFGDFQPDEYFSIDDPGHFFKAGVYRDRELGRADMDWLVNCLYHADVIVTASASIGIDAAIFGKPTVVIHFDGYQTKPYILGVRKCVEYDHPAPLLKSGAMRSAQSREQLLEYLRGYLENPRKDEAARQSMVNDYCGQLDGRAGERIGTFILQQVQ